MKISPEDRVRFADYETAHRPNSRSVYYGTVDGKLVRFYASFYRYDTLKLFTLRMRDGHTPDELEESLTDLANMPRGLWAVWESRKWFSVRMGDGTPGLKLVLGTPVDADFSQWELEVSATTTSFEVLS